MRERALVSSPVARISWEKSNPRFLLKGLNKTGIFTHVAEASQRFR